MKYSENVGRETRFVALPFRFVLTGAADNIRVAEDMAAARAAEVGSIAEAR